MNNFTQSFFQRFFRFFEKKIMFFGNISKNTNFFVLNVLISHTRLFETYFVKNSKVLKNVIYFLNFRTIHSFWYFLRKCLLDRWFDPGWPQNHVFAHIFFLGWQSGRFSEGVGKVENFPIYRSTFSNRSENWHTSGPG